MAIKYELHSISNASGEGKARTFVRLRQLPPMTAYQLEHEIESNTTLKRADVRAVMAELGHYIVRELADGHRFYLPEIGYLSLGVSLDQTKENPTAKDIGVKAIHFRPTQQLIDAVREQTHFEKATDTTRSARYTEEELWTKVKIYVEGNGLITVSEMSREFHLRHSMAAQWMARFVADDLLVKGGNRRSPVYTLAQKTET